ncbi:MAG TPA: BadF/BadG/BcrA/BcrD ATPase family protein [bacterium]|nr:BadF/BadG/BcrA/BcrD ATPase family protein [bacterium]HQO34656.1 BadF/BadG/BcrA/BcrD ATPase family protein [bacterium]HQP99806.1 BadF/BadG/BcrA/BcrD ATPase family protein [bacterium]
MQDLSCVIGIDGGATQTRGILTDPEGRIRARLKAPGTNYHHTGLQDTANLLYSMCMELLKQAGREPDSLRAVCMGLAGAGRPADRQRLHGQISPLFSQETLLLETDASIALHGGCLSKEGVLVIAGTGSIVYGQNTDRMTARVGGYGPILSDDGSGYAIARAGLRAIMLARDGMAPSTMIRDKILRRLFLQSEDDIVEWTMNPQTDKAAIAQLASVVFESLVEGDETARKIIQDAADVFGRAVQCVAGKLNLSEPFAAVLTGGIIEHNEVYFDLVKEEIQVRLPGAEVIHPILQPVKGAVLKALEALDIPIQETLIANLKESETSGESGTNITEAEWA